MRRPEPSPRAIGRPEVHVAAFALPTYVSELVEG